jgi:hypothetical protein
LNIFVELERSFNERYSELNNGRIKILLEVPIDFRSEDSSEGFIVERIDAQDVEVAKEPGRNLASTAARRTHGRQEENVQQLELRRVLLVVPVTVIDPLKWKQKFVNLKIGLVVYLCRREMKGYRFESPMSSLCNICS